jgi:hypothetical protein
MNLARLRLPIALAALLGPVAAPVAGARPAPTAYAAKAHVPFVLGDGFWPSVAVGGNGTAHLVWNAPVVGTAPDTLHYCQLPRGARSCSAVLDLHPPGQVGSRPYLFVRGHDIFLVTHRCCYPDTGLLAFPGLEHTLLFESNDGGRTWPAQGREIGTLDPSGDGLLGPTAGGLASPGWSFMAVTGGNTGGTFFQFGPYSPGTEPHEANLAPSYWFHGSLGFARPSAGSAYDTRPVVTFDDLHRTAFTRYVGDGVFRSLNASVDWTAPRSLGRGVEGRLASGRHGLFLLLRIPGATGDRMVVRKFSGTSFGAPRRVSPPGDRELGEGALAESAGGRLHAAWRRLQAGPDMLRYATSATGHHWATAKAIARWPNMFNVRLGAGGGRVLAVWDENSNSPGGRVVAVVIAGG